MMDHDWHNQIKQPRILSFVITVADMVATAPVRFGLVLKHLPQLVSKIVV
jgi:hypothetical protein